MKWYKIITINQNVAKSLKSNELNISTPLHMTLSNGHSTSKSFSYDEEDEDNEHDRATATGEEIFLA